MAAADQVYLRDTPAKLLPAPVASTGGFTPTTLPTAAACQGCHDDKATASHALANTTAIGESCAVCHGQNAEFSMDKVHSRTQ